MRHLWLSVVLLLGMLSMVEASALERDTLSAKKKILEYRDEIGYFQIANRDASDPRFMFRDKGGNIDFGIGGSVKIMPMMGFGGYDMDLADASDFEPALIAVPADHSNMFTLRFCDSEIHFKARTTIGNNKLVAYIQLNGNTAGEVNFQQAYISFNGLSVGLIPSFFSDLEVGSMTTEITPNNAVKNILPLVGYTHRFNNGWQAALSFEKPTFTGPGLEDIGLGAEYQPLPDIATHVKYRWESGHVQLGAVYRKLTYNSFKPNIQRIEDGVVKYANGYGLSFSGNYKPSDKLKLSWEIVGGRGIGNYVRQLSKLNINLGVCDELDDNGYKKMSAIPVISGYVSAQYDWNSNFSSSVLVGNAHCFDMKDVTCYDMFKNTVYGVANFFWYVSEYAYMGIEYMVGNKSVYYPTNSLNDKMGATAHKVAAIFAYCF